MVSLKTPICELFGIEYPIIQAGMAGGATTVELVSSVSGAGGLGTLGAAYMAPYELRTAINEINSRTSKPFGVNLFAAEAVDDFSRLEDVQEILNSFRMELGISDPSAPLSSPDWNKEQFEICLELGVPIISTAFGLLSAGQMARAKSKNIKVVAMVTTVAEAEAAESAGVDAIVAQGSEAGGHRGTFTLDKHPFGAQIGTMSLVPQVVDAVRVPVIAAGGIVDGRGLAASLVLGAQAVQIGTRFLSSKESGAHKVYKQALFDSTEESTVITKSFSGRPARGIKNRFIEEFELAKVEPLPFPSQNTLTKDIRAAAGKAANPEFMSLWAGQTTRMLTHEMPAADIVRTIKQEADRLFKGG
ncbi:nitronate monooxygenase family protein [Planomicrobium sp. CPCC 101079]|uniref:NAD(P)H-dependent flavin oxidoreductase n=1 Tax=Planomicrobium sp. CPCC 101079 TaxID=2599618 RepID=UPI0011B3FD29|nr:nitronate monooxygenase family protein [Planomicrobium sp. CPCC 101079]TWT02326.1 nitronate monooxygenase [Planomicrobium sp. CPCC 101079]